MSRERDKGGPIRASGEVGIIINRLLIGGGHELSPADAGKIQHTVSFFSLSPGKIQHTVFLSFCEKNKKIKKTKKNRELDG